MTRKCMNTEQLFWFLKNNCLSNLQEVATKPFGKKEMLLGNSKLIYNNRSKIKMIRYSISVQKDYAHQRGWKSKS